MGFKPIFKVILCYPPKALRAEPLRALNNKKVTLPFIKGLSSPPQRLCLKGYAFRHWPILPPLSLL